MPDGSRADGIRIFAAIMLIIGGAFQVLQSIAALVNDEYILILRNYVFSIDLTVWGSIHLIVGLVLAAIGVFLLLGKDWARIAGMVVAALAAVINFTWLPYSPGWAILAIAVNVLVIWALASTLQASVPQPSRQATGQPKT
jgi:hypothetical protein